MWAGRERKGFSARRGRGRGRLPALSLQVKALGGEGNLRGLQVRGGEGKGREG